MLGLDLRQAGTARLPWDVLKAVIEHAPAGSAVARVEVENRAIDWLAHPDLLDMVRMIEYHLSWLHWAKTESSKQAQSQPVPRSLPESLLPKPKPHMALDPEDPEAGSHVIGGTGVEREVMASWLGWEAPPPDAPR